MSEEETQEKQQFLRSEILEAGYNPGNFAVFLGKKRQNGDDIDNWSMRSLTEVVKEYKVLNPEPTDDDEASYDMSGSSDEDKYTLT